MQRKDLKSKGFWKIYVETIENDIQLIFKYWCFPRDMEISEYHCHFKNRYKKLRKKSQANLRDCYLLKNFIKKIVHDQIFEFLQPMFTKNQAAFRKLYSTITSLMNCTDSWYANMNRTEVHLAIFLDLKKALIQSTKPTL